MRFPLRVAQEMYKAAAAEASSIILVEGGFPRYAVRVEPEGSTSR
jgi:hypothetical protein